MNQQEHVERHKKLHEGLDEIVADYLDNTQNFSLLYALEELIRWSKQQTIEPIVGKHVEIVHREN